MNNAVAYFRTSSATNVAGDSSVRQQRAIAAFARAAGLKVVREFYDAATSGADPIEVRKGFAELLAWAEQTGVKTIVVESASRFARDLIVQETGYEFLRKHGFTLIAADDPDAFIADTPTANMVRQILGAVAEFEKSSLVAKLKGARDRASERAGRRIEGRKGHGERNPDIVGHARRLARKNPKTGLRRSLREISEGLYAMGFVNSNGVKFAAKSIRTMLSDP